MMGRCFTALVVALAVGLAAAPAAVDAQSAGMVHRIGYLGSGSSTSGFQAAFVRGVGERGGGEGQHIVSASRVAAGR